MLESKIFPRGLKIGKSKHMKKSKEVQYLLYLHIKIIYKQFSFLLKNIWDKSLGPFLWAALWSIRVSPITIKEKLHYRANTYYYLGYSAIV